MKQSLFKISNAALLAAGLLLSTPGVFAQAQSGTSGKPQSNQLNKSGMSPYMPSNGPMAPQNNVAFTEQHVSDTIRENMALEIQLNQLALARSHDPKIKSFAQRVITENRKIDLDAKKLAPDQSGAFPNTAFGGTRQVVDAQATQKKLKTLTGKKFDDVYLVQMSDYLRSDIQVGHSAYAMMEFPNISPVGLNLWNLSRKRMDELAKLANQAQVHIITD
ncbi:MAG TPA: DUF4142 domain-containing protein [Acidobacteriaceae bacterium]|nr:DUF4142 domain-containing protein [Acidobacteriaceae bacterium]